MLYITYLFYGGAIIFIMSNIVNFRAIKNATSFTTRSIFSGYTTFKLSILSMIIIVMIIIYSNFISIISH